jgi:hypothetical protein
MMTPEYSNPRIGFDTLDREYPFAVDIPIPLRGWGDKLPLLLDATAACTAPAYVWSHSQPADEATAGEVREWWSRVGTKTPDDAKRIARTFRSLGARRVR